MRTISYCSTMTVVAFCGCLFLSTVPVTAGMPAPLPSNFEIESVTRLSDWTRHRIQAISFFVVGVLLSALLVKWLWNSLARDWLRLPRLRYRSALAGTLLWGLMFVIVLTMISGARELMTPGAWRQEGFTYQLSGEASENPAPTTKVNRRRLRLKRLSIALGEYALAHDGRFPSSLDAVPSELRTVPGYDHIKYFYRTGLTTSEPATVLVDEPEIDDDARWILMTDGSVQTLSTEDLNSILSTREKQK